MLSYPEHITTCISTQQRECSPTHPKGIQKSLQNTSPRGVNNNNNNNNLYFVLETWDITVHLITYIVIQLHKNNNS